MTPGLFTVTVSVAARLQPVLYEITVVPVPPISATSPETGSTVRTDVRELVHVPPAVGLLSAKVVPDA